MRSKDVALDDTEAWPSSEHGAAGAPVGAVIGGRYRVRALLGLGGMGAVYEGEQIELRKRVAIKLIAPEREASPDVLARFRRESRAASLAESENIVQVFDCGHDELWGFYLVMELLRGEDLGATLQRRHSLPVDEALGIALQVARGLTKAHAAGVIHRDLKPENIFLVPREEGYPLAKIVDFGISKVFEDATEVTRQGTVIGTVQYMSPEQARGEAIDGRTDIWALGCVMYEMLTGELALGKEPTLERIFMRLVQKGVRPIREVAPHLDRDVIALVNQTLSFDAKSRIATARELAIHIARLRAQVSGTVSINTFAAPSLDEFDDAPTLVASMPALPAAHEKKRRARIETLPEAATPSAPEMRVSGEPASSVPPSVKDERVDPGSIRAARLLIARAAVSRASPSPALLTPAAPIPKPVLEAPAVVPTPARAPVAPPSSHKLLLAIVVALGLALAVAVAWIVIR